MRKIAVVLPIVFAVASVSAASAQSAKPADPSSWGEGAVENAHSGSPGAVVSGYATTHPKGLSSARHDDGEGDSHPTPPSGVSVPVGCCN